MKTQIECTKPKCFWCGHKEIMSFKMYTLDYFEANEGMGLPQFYCSECSNADWGYNSYESNNEVRMNEINKLNEEIEVLLTQVSKTQSEFLINELRHNIMARLIKIIQIKDSLKVQGKVQYE